MHSPEHPMTTIRITDATVEPITLDQAKRHLREDLEDAGNDEDIAAMIVAARMAAEDRLQRALVQSTWRLTLDAFPDVIELQMGRIISVDSVQYVDESGNLQTFTDWLADLASEPGRVVPAYGLSWPATRAEPGSVRVTYKAGYGTTADSVPAPVLHWIKLALTDLYEQRSRSAERPAVPMQFADGLLDAYRVWSL